MSANFQSEWKTSGFFSLNLEKLPNYVQYFGLNIAEGVVESWVEVDGARWSWVCGLVIPFFNIYKTRDTYSKILCV